MNTSPRKWKKACFGQRPCIPDFLERVNIKGLRKLIKSINRLMPKQPKKAYRKIPERISAKLATIQGPVVASFALVVPAASINEDRFAALRLTATADGQILFPEPWVPEIQGRISKVNRIGKETIRRDLPKIWKTYSFEAPNFGDWEKGSHEVSRTIEVYQRDFDPPREVRILVRALEGKPECHHVATMEILQRHQPDFDRRLLFGINLLQELFGRCDVMSVNATAQEMADSIDVAWELLPPGTLSAAALWERLSRGRTRNGNQLLGTQIEQRRQLMESLNPLRWIIGQSGFRRYFGAQFSDNFAVFENIEYGNALYGLQGDWATLSQLSRLELLSLNQGVTRIVHRPGWENKLRRLIAENRHDEPPTTERAA
jgi:hypothetical protein